MTVSVARTNRSAAILERLFERYDRSGRAINVTFRKLVDWVPMRERATHYLHPYPAKLLPQIPAFFLSNSLLSSEGDTVLDPFCGSGTVLLESVLHARDAIGADSNPLARLVANAKVASMRSDNLPSLTMSLLRKAVGYRAAAVPSVVNIEHWFLPRTIDELARLRRAVSSLDDIDVRHFFQVCLSSCVRRVSMADPRISVPVRLKYNQYPRDHPLRRLTNARLRRLRTMSVYVEFTAIVDANIRRLEALNSLRDPGARASVVSTDARRLRRGACRLRTGSIDLVMTSPPYAGAQKYVRASSLSIGWLDLDGGRSLRELEDDNIGREHFPTSHLAAIPPTGNDGADSRLHRIARRNPTRALIAATYLVEMKAALTESVRVLKPGGYMVLVAGNNSVCGLTFRTETYLKAMLEEMGLITRLRLVDAIRSRGLMTRRNAAASVITREWVTVFRKDAHDRGRR